MSRYLVEGGGHRGDDAGRGTLLPGKVLLVAYLMESSS